MGWVLIVVGKVLMIQARVVVVATIVIVIVIIVVMLTVGLVHDCFSYLQLGQQPQQLKKKANQIK